VSEAPDEAAITPARGEQHGGRRVLHNSAVMTVGQIVVVLVGLILTPVTVSYVGLAVFGIWGLITTAVSYLLVLDPGIGGVVLRYGAMAQSTGDDRLMARLTTLGSGVWLGLGLAGLPIVILFVPPFVHHIHLAGISASTVIAFFYWGYGLLVADTVLSVINSQLVAIGDLWLVSIIDIVTRVLYGVVLVAGFLSGWGLWAIVVASFAQVISSYVVTLFFCWRRVSFPYGNPFRLDRATLREVMRFGAWGQLTGILDTLTYNTDAIVISGFISATATGIYNVANRLARQISFFSTAPHAVLPAMSAAHGAGEGYPAIARMMTRANRMTCILGALMGSIILGAAPVLLAAWLGHHYPKADLATCLISIGLLIGLLRQAAGLAIYAVGKVGYGARARIVAFFVNLVVTLALVIPMGISGVLIGTVLATLASTIYLQIRVQRLLGASAHDALWSWAMPLIIATLPAILLDRLLLFFMPISVQVHRGPALLALSALSILNYTAIIVCFRLARVIQPEDVSTLRRALPTAARRFTRPWMVRILMRPDATAATP